MSNQKVTIEVPNFVRYLSRIPPVVKYNISQISYHATSNQCELVDTDFDFDNNIVTCSNFNIPIPINFGKDIVTLSGHWAIALRINTNHTEFGVIDFDKTLYLDINVFSSILQNFDYELYESSYPVNSVLHKKSYHLFIRRKDGDMFNMNDVYNHFINVAALRRMNICRGYQQCNVKFGINNIRISPKFYNDDEIQGTKPKLILSTFKQG